ncbi:YciI family protein [Aldersonia sp. NBC_00410]|uniref:YciI family protein n=1 Tax=Aldersonia sp. NBC_00410 TaxID=2975954 RepID=UPI0022548D75|nr:YciI family protein [Aldersonia sp. NBC_00410]MCX5045745.1 YciI family protein [Aldersonia sp. NBC_00410]
MTQYMLSVVVEPSDYDVPLEEAQSQFDATGRFNEELKTEGSWVFAGGLGRVDEATTVDGTGSDVIVTDGPFVETKECLGGFWVVEAPDLDAALKIAARASKVCEQKIEIRTFDGA